ncbi:hypothetical protein IV203_026552 [Nitzschia inconspicua]|uniref:Uncharacterized protein n=1 Tax=Nitzschia inconspicua TaxID=303405 RepID=A0A9K3PX94_9STRA|nr:hypothetical protein IV203_026552 [Nitzschia inconspicua]
MSHWTTSGRSRLKAKQNQSFSYRSRQRAALVHQNLRQVEAAVESRESVAFENRQRRHNGKSTRKNTNPVFRRGIIVSIGNHRDGVLHDEEGSFQSEHQEAGRLTPHPMQSRRIRDWSSVRLYANSTTTRGTQPRNAVPQANTYNSFSRCAPCNNIHGGHHSEGYLENTFRGEAQAFEEPYQSYSTTSLNRRQDMSAPRNLFPSNDESCFSRPFEATQDCHDRTSNGSRGHLSSREYRADDYNTTARPFASRLHAAREYNDEENSFRESQGRVAMHGVPRFSHQKAEKENPFVFCRQYNDEDCPFGKVTSENFLGNQSIPGVFYESHDPFVQDSLGYDKYPPSRALDFPSPSGPPQIDEGDWPLDPLQGLFGREEIREKQHDIFSENQSDRPSQTGGFQFDMSSSDTAALVGMLPSTSCGLKRFQKRKSMSRSDDGPLSTGRVKTNYLSREIEDRHHIWGGGGCKLNNDAFDTAQDHDQDTMSPFSPQSISKGPDSPLSLHFYNEGKRIEISGQQLNTNQLPTLISIPKESQYDNTCPPEFLF